MEITTHNTQTNEIITRLATKAESDELQKVIDNSNFQIMKAEAKATARASALAKLAALGLSADEIAAF